MATFITATSKAKGKDCQMNAMAQEGPGQALKNSSAIIFSITSTSTSKHENFY